MYTAHEAAVRARITLGRVAEPGNRLISRLVREAGPVQVVDAIWAESADELLPADRENRMDRIAIRDHAYDWATRIRYAVDPDVDLAAAAACGATFITPECPDAWPTQLNDLGDVAPLGLWTMGESLVGRRSIVVTGTRTPTSYGKHVADEFAAGLVARGWAVASTVSGIDRTARVSACANRGVTVTIAPYGIDTARSRDALTAAWLAGGGRGDTLLSETPLGAEPSRRSRLDSARLLAAIGEAVVVIEAKAQSTALVTARIAGQLGRRVVAAPGPVSCEGFEGSHRLIRAGGATLATCALDAVEGLRWPAAHNR